MEKKEIHRNRTRYTCLRCISKKIKCDHGNPCNRCFAAGVSCEYSNIKRESPSIGLAENEDASSIHSPALEPDLEPPTHSVNSLNLLEGIEAIREELNAMEKFIVRERPGSLTPPPQIASPEQDRHLLSNLPKDSAPSDDILQELEKYDLGHLKRFCPLNWDISFEGDGHVVIYTSITNATDLAAEIERLCTLQEPPGKNPLRSKSARSGGIHAAEAMPEDESDEISDDDVLKSPTERFEGDEITEEELRAFSESPLPPKKDPVRQHWSSIYGRAVSKFSPAEGFPAFDSIWEIPQGLDLPAMRTSFLLMAYHVCYIYFQGTSLSPNSANSSHQLLQYARCAWSAQHIAIHHSSPAEREIMSSLIKDPVALSESYYLCARGRLEELFDVPDVQTVESLMILSNVQAHWNLKQSSRYLGLAIHMAIECDLHRVGEVGLVYQQDGQEEVENCNFFFGKSRDRRVWWLLCYYDLMHAIMGESQPIIPQQLGIGVPTLLAPLDPENLTARVIYYTCEMMKLTRIMRNFVIAAPHTKEDQPQPTSLETAVVGLRDWYDSVPELLRLKSDAPLPSQTMPVILQMRFLLDLHYYFFCLIIYAPFFLAPKEGEALPPVPEHLRYYATQICARASEIVTGHILAVLALEKTPSYPQHLFSIDTILSKALTVSARVAEHQLIRSKIPREQLAARESLERCAEALKKNRLVFSPSGSHLASKIDELLGSRADEGIEDYMAL